MTALVRYRIRLVPELNHRVRRFDAGRQERRQEHERAFGRLAVRHHRSDGLRPERRDLIGARPRPPMDRRSCRPATVAAALIALLFVAASIGVGVMSPERASATRIYMSPVIFHFTNEKGVVTIGRYQLIPDAGRHFLSKDEIAKSAVNYLEDEIRQRVAHGAVLFKLVLQLAAASCSSAYGEARNLLALNQRLAVWRLDVTQHSRGIQGSGQA